MNLKAVKRALDVEESRRAKSLNLTSLDPATIADGHKPQQAVLEDEETRQIWLCSRRAAKSVSVCAKMAYLALKYPNSIVIYFGATYNAVHLLIWEPVWKRFRTKWGVGGTDTEKPMVTRFANGSVVLFAGADDYKHVESYLGGKLRAVFIDEAQSQPDSVLVPLVDRILPPALSDLDGTLILSGTIPEVEAGKFYNIWREKDKYPSWSRHNWNRFANPHIESTKTLMKELINSGRTIDDPIIRRDWFGEFVFSSELTAFRYDRSIAGYDGNYPGHLNMFSVGVDPGTRDRTAIVVWGWSAREPVLYHVHEWVTKRDSHTNLSDIAKQLQIINERWSPIPWWYVDMGGSAMAIDTFTVDYGLPVIHAAKKTDRLMQVKRLGDLLATGKAKVRIGSALEEDLSRAQWDKDARARGQYQWSNVWHPDVADAGRYAAQGFFDAYKLPKAPEDFVSADARKELEAWKRELQPPVDEAPWKRDLDDLGYGYGGK